VVDQRFFDTEIVPRLGERVRYLGHLDQQALARAVGRSSVALVTPTWDEPYGLVVAEALSCGTPVAAFRRGGIPEILTPASGLLAEPGDVPALAAAARHAGSLSRRAARRHAVQRCSVDTMANAYCDLFRGMQPLEPTPLRRAVAADTVSA
jgi:glycosyltransferase involved in cell wall biosynthesis